jgi:outer membrane protein assembly factor BamB
MPAPRRHTVRIGVVMMAAVAVSFGLLGASAPAAPTPGSAPPASTGAAAGPASAGWPAPGQNLDNARSAVGSRITAKNVASLQTPFSTDLPGAFALSTAPLVVDGTVYLQGASGAVVAVDASSGTTRWSSPPTGYNIGPFGVAIADGRVFADAGSNGILALDQHTGAELWRTRITTTPTLGVDIQPTVFDGIVFAATVPVSVGGIYTPGDRGTLVALDATTGAVRWTFDTVQGDLWGHPEINSGGGAWYPPAIDTRRRTAYFGTANPAPFVGTAEFPNGQSRPGDNLYTDSVVALDIDTGALRWYHQVTKHDLFDRDQVHVMLAHLRNGREVVVSAGKSGEVVGLAPASGRVLWQQSVGIHEHDTDSALFGPTVVYPGTYGGVLTPPATAKGVVYVATNNAPTELPPDAPSYFGGQLGTHDGEVVAIDAASGAVVWDTKVPGDPLGGATVVNDLVLTALLDGSLVALDRGTGKIVWKHATGGGVNGWLAAVDDTLYVPVGNAKPPKLLALRLP